MTAATDMKQAGEEASRLCEAIRSILDDDLPSLEILAAACGLLEAGSTTTLNLDDEGLQHEYELGRDLGAQMLGGVDEHECGDRPSIAFATVPSRDLTPVRELTVDARGNVVSLTPWQPADGGRWKGWKHPSHFDTWGSLPAARRSYPHIGRFKRVLLSASMERHLPTGDLYRPAIDPRTGRVL